MLRIPTAERADGHVGGEWVGVPVHGGGRYVLYGNRPQPLGRGRAQLREQEPARREGQLL
jgi:hypothetical protein